MFLCRPDAGDYDKRTALHLAAASGAEKAVECLLSHGVDVNPKDRWGGIPLMDAIMGGHLMATLVLRNAGGKLTDKGTSASFLCEAASEGDVGKLKLLRDCNIDMNEVRAGLSAAFQLPVAIMTWRWPPQLTSRCLGAW